MKRSEDRPVAAHYHEVYLNPTETFIYAYLRSFRRYRAAFLARRAVHPERFPWRDLFIAERPGALGWIARAEAAIRRKPFSDVYFDRVLWRLGPRVVHAHFGLDGFLALPLARRHGAPLVTSFYGADASTFPRDPVWRDRYRTLFAGGRAFLVEGPALAERLVELGCPREKVHLQPIAIEPEYFPPRDPGAASAPLRIVACGRFIEKKGFDDALRATAKVLDAHPDIELRLIGDGPLRGDLEQEAKALGIEKAVRFLGMLSWEQYRQELRSASVVLQPSRVARDGDTEGGAPTVLLEAQASAVPVVATRHADIPAIVADGEAGFLVPERDVDGLAGALDRLLGDRALRERMGAAGRERILGEHAAPMLVARLEKLYDDVTAG